MKSPSSEHGVRRDGWTKAFIGALTVATLVEALFPLGGFLAPEFTLQLFKVEATPSTLFLGHVLAWMLLLATLVLAACLKGAIKGEAWAWRLVSIISVWWIVLGISMAIKYSIFDNLALDSAKGALLLVLSAKSQPKALT